MISKIIEYFKNIDKLTYKIIKIGLSFCSILSIISSILLFIYGLSAISPNIYHASFAFLKCSLIFGVEFIICGLSIDTIKKQLI